MGQEPLEYIWRANSRTTEGEHHPFVSESIGDLLRVGAVVNVTSQRADLNVVRVVAPLTVAVTVDAQGKIKKRLCWNGRPLNLCADGHTQRLPQQKFKLEGPDVAAKLMRAGDWMFTLDMKAGYHQIPVKEWWRRYLCFQWEGEVYQWQVLPFGLSTAPRAYSKLTRALVARWREQGVRVSNYLDDFIFFAHTLEEAVALRRRVLADFTSLGWFLSTSKCMLKPGTRVGYLGLEFCSLPVPHLRVPHSKVQAFRERLRPVLRRHARVLQGGGIKQAPNEGGVRTTGFTLAVLLGKLQSFRLATPVVALLTRALYDCLKQLPGQVEGYMDFGAEVTLTPAALAECQFWYSRLPTWNGFSLLPVTITRVLYTDASGAGLGGMIHRVLARVMEPAILQIAEYWEPEMDEALKASVVTELVGLSRALVAGRAALAGESVLHRTDNICTYRVVVKGGSQRSARLTRIVRRIFLFCLTHGITLSSQYVGADVIIRSGADALSRVDDRSDCRLNKGVFGRLWYVFGPFHVDRFASANAVQSDPASGRELPYFSLHADSRCTGIDALTADWRGVTNYAFPPVSLVGLVLRLLREQGATALVIVPKWPAQWWWPLLLSMARGPQVELVSLLAEGELFERVREGGPCTPLGGYLHQEGTCWLAVWVPGTAEGRQGFQGLGDNSWVERG